MSYKFIYEDETAPPGYPKQVEFVMEDSRWPDLLTGFMAFLRANGFYIPFEAEVVVLGDDGEDLIQKAQQFEMDFGDDE